MLLIRYLVKMSCVNIERERLHSSASNSITINSEQINVQIKHGEGSEKEKVS